MQILSKQLVSEIEQQFLEYPRKVNALLPVLHLVQKELGYISSEAIGEVAALCEVPVSHVEGVVTFYTMYAREKRGKCYLGVCTNISCFITGGVEILEKFEEMLGIHAGESTPDGKFFLEEVECLGACGFSPAVLVNEDYYEKVTPEQVEKIVSKFEKEG